jgi:hypothetical protein
MIQFLRDFPRTHAVYSRAIGRRLLTIISFAASPGRSLAPDLVFVSTLLALSAVPLIFLRGSTWLHETSVLAVIFAAWIGWIALWTMARPRDEDRPRSRRRPDAMGGVAAQRGFRLVLSIGLLLALVIAAFFFPLRLNFWGGYDEFASLFDNVCTVWSDDWDRGLSRPLLGLQAFVAQILTPGRIDGLLYVAVGLCSLNALLLIGIIRRMLPGGAAVAMAAGTLLVVNRAEPLLSYVAWTTNFYWAALFWFLLALYLMLLSQDHASRWLLAMSCASLGAALLTSEGLFPLSLLAPVLLWLRNGNRERRVIWMYAWLGTVALLAIRLTIFLFSNVSYQGGLLARARMEEMLQNAAKMLSLVDTYFTLPQSLPQYSALWLLGFALAFGAIAMSNGPVRRIGARACLIGMAIAVVANVLAIAAYIPLSTTWRTQYFAAPIQAAFMALGIGLVCSATPRFLNRLGVAALTAIFVANLTASSWHAQENADPRVRFEKTVHIFEQVHALSTDFPPDSLVLFFLDDNTRSPLGMNYHVMFVSRIVLGVSALQANFSDPVEGSVKLHENGIDLLFQGTTHYAYGQLLAFRLAADGTVSLLTKLPQDVLPGAGMDVAYMPLARLHPGPVEKLRYLQYPPWSEHAVDIIDAASGVVFGEYWGPRIAVAGQTARWADNDAELIVNPGGKGRLELRFMIEPGPEFAGRASQLVILDDDGRALESVDLGGARQLVRFDVPLDPRRVVRLRLRIGDRGDDRVDPAPASFLVLRPDRARATRWQPWPSPDIIEPRDRLRLGRNWQGLESRAGEIFRRMENGAEVLVNAVPGAGVTLACDVEGPPSDGAAPIRLEARGEDNRVLAEVELRGRRRWEIDLPPAARRQRVLRLRTAAGGAHVPTDSRILDLRVFHCQRVAG